jgi:tetratricopeptide (TPR) repeat protein
VIPAKQKSPPPTASTENKEAAKNCLHEADKYLKDGDFEKAKEQVSKAKELDPTNPYTFAFQDRIDYFEQLKKKEVAQVKPAAPLSSTPPSVAQSPKLGAPSPQATPPAQKMPTLSPPSPAQEHPAAPIFPMTPASHQPAPPVTPTPMVAAPPGPKYTPPPAPPPPPPEPEAKVEKRPVTPPVQESRAHDSMLFEMKRQIEELSKALEQEKHARKEISSLQLHNAIKQYRQSLEKVWVNGAPPEKESQELRQLASTLGIPDDAQSSTIREVKLDMYSKAVKEMVAKRKLLKNSSSTMDWLRKVYQISMTEYLENESKFLLDLVADQFKGTMLFVTSDANAKNSLVPKLKMAGYAVVLVPNPESALEKIERINPNIILCETEFPAGSLSGIKFLHVLRVNSKFNFLPFVLLCEAEEVPNVQSSELKPNEGFVKKPYDFDELSELMNQKLAQFREYISSL